MKYRAYRPRQVLGLSFGHVSLMTSQAGMRILVKTANFDKNLLFLLKSADQNQNPQFLLKSAVFSQNLQNPRFLTDFGIMRFRPLIK